MDKDNEENVLRILHQLKGKTITELDAWRKEQVKIDLFEETNEGKALFMAYFHAIDAYENRREEESDEVRKKMDNILSEVGEREDRDLFSVVIVSCFSFYGTKLDALINEGLPAHLQAYTETYFKGLFKRGGMDYDPCVLERAKSGNSLTSEENVALESAIICAYGKILEREALEVVNYKQHYPRLHDTPMTITGELKSRKITDSEVEP